MITPKALAYGLLRGSGLTGLARTRERAAVFCFHNVVADEDVGRGDSSLHLGVASFGRIVDFLATTFEVVPLAELGSRLRAGRSIRRLAALTFDDAYAGVCRHALPLLAERGVPSTVFVVPEKSDAPAAFWWDVLAEEGRLGDDARSKCLTELAGDERKVLNGSSGVTSLPDSMLPATWDMLRAAPGPVAMGSHTLRHLNLTRVAPPELARDLATSRERLRAELTIDADLISYPYGLFDEGVTRAAADAGYGMGITMKYGLVRPGQDVMSLPRINVPARVDVDALDSWSVGWRLRKPS